MGGGVTIMAFENRYAPSKKSLFFTYCDSNNVLRKHNVKFKKQIYFYTDKR
jgi:hypothetical protein